MNNREFKQQVILTLLGSANLPKFDDLEQMADYLGEEISQDIDIGNAMKLGEMAMSVMLNNIADRFVEEFEWRNPS